MRKNNFSVKYLFVGFFVLIFILMQVKVCYAEKLGFKAEHNENKKETIITFDVVTPKYKLVEEGKWFTLTSRGEEASRFLKKGEPELTYLTYLLSIPQDSKVKNIAIKPITKEFNLSKHLKPIPESVIVGEPPKPPIPDDKLYGSLKPYPNKDFDYEIAKQGTTAMLVLTVYPFKYIGKTKTLRVSEYMEVTIILSANNWRPNPHPRNAVDKNLKMRLVNPESAFFKGSAQ